MRRNPNNLGPKDWEFWFLLVVIAAGLADCSICPLTHACYVVVP